MVLRRPQKNPINKKLRVFDDKLVVSNENLGPLISCPGSLINWGIAKYVVVSRDELFHLVHSWFLKNPSFSLFLIIQFLFGKKNEQNGFLVIKIIWTNFELFILVFSFIFLENNRFLFLWTILKEFVHRPISMKITPSFTKVLFALQLFICSKKNIPISSCVVCVRY